MMADTIRLTNLRFVQTTLRTLDLTGPGDLTSPNFFTLVSLGPIDGFENRMRYTAGIVPGDEIKKTLYPITDCTLPVTVEFRMTWNTGDASDHEAESERLLGLIEKVLVQDRTLGGNAIDFYTVGNAITMDLFTEKDIIGAIHFEMRYRHNSLDPTLIA
jgi:hypothetical protein